MNIIKTKFQIVVARYNENIKWLLPYKDITIVYNKGNDDNILLNNFNTVKLNNYGRESHTYLYHIINNYDNLAEKTIFFQGKIDDHKILDIEDYFGINEYIGHFDNLKIDKLKKKIEHYGKWKTDYTNGNMKICNYTPYEWLTKIIGLDINSEFTKVVWGANFSVSKNIILSKPKIFYENIIRHLELDKNPEEGHFLERSWYLIFNNSYTLKKKIGYIFINDIDTDIKNYFDNYDYEEIHIFHHIVSNFELGNKYKISYTPNNNKYLLINPNIDNNIFYLDIKSKNDSHILIEFENNEDKYEIVFGGWNNNKSIIRNFANGNILNTNNKPILDNNKFIKFNFDFSEKIIIKADNNIIFDFNNIFEKSKIKTVKIKSYFGSDAFWNYDHVYSTNVKLLDNMKLYLRNNTYDNPKYFYKNYYLDYYIVNLSE